MKRYVANAIGPLMTLTALANRWLIKATSRSLALGLESKIKTTKWVTEIY